MKQSHFTIIALVLMVAAFTFAAVFHNAEQEQAASEKASKHSGALVKAYSMTAGNPNAKVTLVEFMDPACGTCAQFYPFVKSMMQHYDGKIHLVVRYAPFHQNSDQMVAILEAARKQSQFWPVLELMFSTQQQWVEHHVGQPDVFLGILENAGLVDVAKLRQEMTNPNIIKIIRQDLADGELLGADKTPSFFVNGKPLPSFGYQQLKDLVDTEVANSY